MKNSSFDDDLRWFHEKLKREIHRGIPQPSKLSRQVKLLEESRLNRPSVTNSRKNTWFL